MEVYHEKSFCLNSIATPFFLTATANPLAGEDEFAGGSGTAEDPFLVETAEHLSNVRHYLEAYFLQIDDIELFVEPWNTGSGWNPIGRSSSRFKGEYDGNNFVIRNMMINAPSGTGEGSIYWGLFGYTEDAILRNIHLEDIDLIAAEHIDELYHNIVGALAGETSGGLIYNCSVVGGGISSESDHAGGLVGINSANMFGVFTHVNISGEDNVGGLIGSSTGVRESIVHAYSRGSVSGENNVGGLVGRLQAGYITDSYSRASVSGENYVGGFVGVLGAGSNHNMINRCYSIGSVNSTGDDVGGFSASITATTTVLNSFWDTQNSGITQSAAGIRLSTEEMQQKASYNDFNFQVRWSIDEGNDYPVFQDFDIYQQPQPVELSELDGSGTPEDPYIITTLDELNAMRQDITANYILANDIDMAATVVWDHGRGWIALGEHLSSFTGSLDGDGYTLRNMTINRAYDSYQGLFGSCQGARISNLHLENVDIMGSQLTGSVTGLAGTGSEFENISATGVVMALFSQIGGIVGSSRGGKFHNVAADVNVYGTERTAGFVGNVEGGEIKYSYSLGNVYGGTYAGGFAGRLHGRSTTSIHDCYSRGHVHSDGHLAYAGGFIGSVEASEVKRSYSTGTVTVTSQQGIKGGFAGINNRDRNIEDCYWDTESSQEATSDGAEGRTTGQMAYPYHEETFVGWDFDEIWIADKLHSVNDGYPYLPCSVRESDVIITLIADPDDAGIVEGDGSYEQGQQVSVTAQVHEEFVFINWTEDGSEVSVSEEYSFEATVNRTLTANFEPAEEMPEYPEISAIADQTIQIDTDTGALSFTVGSKEVDPGTLTLSGSSSNTMLAPNANIVFGGSGSNRTVTVTPASGKSGSATITITVDDGDQTASTSFALYVQVPPEPPTISAIFDQTILVDTDTGALSFTVGSTEIDPGTLTLSGFSSNTTLVPITNIVFGGSGADRTVTVTPAADQSGSVMITITVDDGEQSADTSFALNVEERPELPEPPKLVIERSGVSQVRLSWPASAVGLTLQRSPEVGGEYIDTGLPVSVEGDENVAYDTIILDRQFYRLVK